ncbi:DUF637 domain-containing protein [Pseudomonas chlororaphis]
MAAAGTSVAGTATAAGWANVAATAVVTSAASGAAISTINNRGNLGAVVKDVTSSDSLKSYVVAGVSGGIAGQSIGVRLAVNSALKTVVNGGKFKDNLSQAAIGLAADALSGAIYEKVGDRLVGTGLPTKVAVHAIVGGLIGEAAGGDFTTAALAAGANKALIQKFGDEIFPGVAHEQVLAMTSQLLGMTVAAAAGGSEKDQQVAGWVAQQATVYNELKHKEVEDLIEEGKACVATNTCDKVREKYANLNDANSKRLEAICGTDPTACKAAYSDWVANYQKTNELISQARTSNDVPEEVKRMLVAVQLMNANTQIRLVGAGIVQGAMQSVSDAAGQVGIEVKPETLGTVAKWTAILFGIKNAAGEKGGALVTKGSEVTPEIIQKALKGDKTISAQDGVSLPAIQRYVDRLLKGDIAPPIKMDGDVIVDGNHRYIAAKVLGREVEVNPGVLTDYKASKKRPTVSLEISPLDWGSK